jgi:hypothetical protein
MTRFRNLFAIFGAALAAATIEAGEVASLGDDLFSVVRAVRDAARSDRISDPSHFSRKWLEDVLRGVDATSGEDAAGFDLARDELLVGLATFNNFDAVYSYQLTSTDQDPVALRMQLSNCGNPGVLTIGFRMEAGTWKIHSRVLALGQLDVAWYRDGLVPIQSWPRIVPRHRPWEVSPSASTAVDKYNECR